MIFTSKFHMRLLGVYCTIFDKRISKFAAISTPSRFFWKIFSNDFNIKCNIYFPAMSHFFNFLSLKGSLSYSAFDCAIIAHYVWICSLVTFRSHKGTSNLDKKVWYADFKNLFHSGISEIKYPKSFQ